MRYFLTILSLSILSGSVLATDCIVLLHGIARNPSSLSELQASLEQQGYSAKSFTYPDRDKNLQDIIDDIHPAIDTFTQDCSGQIHFVTHSMGGLVARAYIRKYRPGKLGKVVMLAPPNQGSEVADALKDNTLYKRFFGPAGQQLTTHQTLPLSTLLGTPDYPLGIIAGDRSINPLASYLLLPGADDGAVTVSRTQLPGMTDFIVLPATHTFMMNNTNVQQQTLHFLQTGRFTHPHKKGGSKAPSLQSPD